MKLEPGTVVEDKELDDFILVVVNHPFSSARKVKTDQGKYVNEYSRNEKYPDNDPVVDCLPLTDLKRPDLEDGIEDFYTYPVSRLRMVPFTTTNFNAVKGVPTPLSETKEREKQQHSPKMNLGMTPEELASGQEEMAIQDLVNNIADLVLDCPRDEVTIIETDSHSPPKIKVARTALADNGMDLKDFRQMLENEFDSWDFEVSLMNRGVKREG